MVMVARESSAFGHRWLVPTLLFAAITSPATAPAAVDRELLSTARDGNRSSVEAIETLCAEIKLSIGFEGNAQNDTLTATYWREFGLVRIHEVSSHGVVTDYRGAGGKVNRLVERPVPNANAKVIGLLVGRDAR